MLMQTPYNAVKLDDCGGSSVQHLQTYAGTAYMPFSLVAHLRMSRTRALCEQVVGVRPWPNCITPADASNHASNAAALAEQEAIHPGDVLPTTLKMRAWMHACCAGQLRLWYDTSGNA